MMKFRSCHHAHSPQDPLNFLVLSITNFLRVFPSRAYATSTAPNLTNYLMKSLEYSPHEAAAISSRFRPTATTQKPKSVVSYLKSLGFSITHLQTTIRTQPMVLFLDVDKILKPKVEFYQQLDLHGHGLAFLISKNPTLLTSSLDKKLKPSIAVIKRVLELYGGKRTDGETNFLLFRILSRYCWVIGSGPRLESNMAYLRSCGVDDSQLIIILKNELRLFSMQEPDLKGLVARAVGMGFEKGSKMLAYGILALYSNSTDNISRKLRLLYGLGFTKDECSLMFVRSPMILKSSEEKLRRGVEFFTRSLGYDRSLLVGSPCLLNFSMERRVLPRLKLMEMVMSRGLLEKEVSFITVVSLSEKEFVRRFVSKFGDDAEVLKLAYDKWRIKSS